MQIKIDFRSSAPIYVQIMEQIRQMVANNELTQGDQLPTVRQLATELRVNFNTVARAYRILDEVGLISTQRGRGTYIWEQPTEEAMKQLKKKNLEELARNYWAEARQLGTTLEDAIEELKRASQTGAPVNQKNDLPEKEL